MVYWPHESIAKSVLILPCMEGDFIIILKHLIE